MAAAATTTLDSLSGRRGVDIGSSFTRAWNERTGKTTKRSKDYPNPEYYSLRYKFKPESIDNEGTGALTPKVGDGHMFELERPSLQGDSHRFTAVEQPSKEWECVLLWDPATQQLTLEKLESTLNLTYDGRGKGKRPASPTPSSPGSSRTKRMAHNSNTASAERDKELEDFERALAGDSDAEGEPDDDFDEIQAELEAFVEGPTKQEEEEEEEEMEAVEVEPPQAPPSSIKAKVAKAPPKAPSKASAKVPSASKPKPRARPGSSAKKEVKEVDGIEEEELTFGEPTKRTRRPRAPTTTNNTVPSIGANNSHSSGLALPTKPTSVSMPPPLPPVRHAPPTPSDLLQPPPITYAGSESGSDSDESDDGGQEFEESLDAAALERELESELAEVADDDEEGMEAIPIENGQHNSGRPLSLNELFGEGTDGIAEPSDDSSSDDSDDD